VQRCARGRGENVDQPDAGEDAVSPQPARACVKTDNADQAAEADIAQQAAEQVVFCIHLHPLEWQHGVDANNGHAQAAARHQRRIASGGGSQVCHALPEQPSIASERQRGGATVDDQHGLSQPCKPSRARAGVGCGALARTRGARELSVHVNRKNSPIVCRVNPYVMTVSR